MTQARLTEIVRGIGILTLASVLALPAKAAPGTAATPATTETATKAATAPQAPAATEPEKDVKTKRSGRHLPTYYGSVIDDQQRSKIYAIQDEYAPKINALKEQLDALTTERDTKVSAVLTAEQRAKVEAKKAEAKANRAAKAASRQSTSGTAASDAAKPAPTTAGK
jgi:Spy/CpxP family protein refolding chaperone